MSYPDPCPHDPIEQLTDDLFIVRGSIRMNPLVSICRNMVIVRHAGELTLVDPVRLMPEAEEQLLALGEVKRVLRLGPMHGMDDPWYIDQFGAELWAPPGGEVYPDPPPDVVIDESLELPFPAATLFMFERTLQGEGALLLAPEASPGGEGLLITCDAVQHYGDYSNCSFLARLLMPFIGFPKTTLIGPVWLKMLTAEGDSLRDQFERLLELPFDALFSAHGTLLESGAKTALRAAITKAFD